MFTLSGNNLPVRDQKHSLPTFETMRHVAYRCGCVRTYKKHQETPGVCSAHIGEPVVSARVEVVRTDIAA